MLCNMYAFSCLFVDNFQLFPTLLPSLIWLSLAFNDQTKHYLKKME